MRANELFASLARERFALCMPWNAADVGSDILGRNGVKVQRENFTMIVTCRGRGGPSAFRSPAIHEELTYVVHTKHNMTHRLAAMDRETIRVAPHVTPDRRSREIIISKY